MMVVNAAIMFRKVSGASSKVEPRGRGSRQMETPETVSRLLFGQFWGCVNYYSSRVHAIDTSSRGRNAECESMGLTP